jgi:hypothetical protein
MTYLLQSQFPHRSLSFRRFAISAIVSLIALLVAMGSFTYTARAADTCSTTSCVMACNVRQKICSRFPRTQVPSGYIRVSFIPYGYRRVSQSKCDRMICPSYVKDCRRWVPTQTGK